MNSLQRRVPAFHLYLPQMRMSHEAIVERALAAEGSGFEGIAFMDHLAPPLASEQDMWEAMSIASWVLAKTTALSVGHLVLCDTLRHPSVLARQVTSLDHASGGRFELGIGWGSVASELSTFGVGSLTAAQRAARLGESLKILRGLWTGEVISVAGAYFTVEGAQQRPVPTRRIPITIGGTGAATLELVREHADWWNVPVHQLDRLSQLRDQVPDVPVSIQVMVAVLESEQQREQVTEIARRRFGGTAMFDTLVIGTAAELVDHFTGLSETGIDRFYVWFADFAPVVTVGRFAAIVEALT